MDLDYNIFIDSIKKVKDNRVHKINNAYGIIDTFKDYTNMYNINRHVYVEIIKAINKDIAEDISKGKEVKLPHYMGNLELRKKDKKFIIKKTKITNNLAINWQATLKLWYEDTEAKKNKTLVKSDTDAIYRIYYNKLVAKYVNKSFYSFKANRKLKLALKDNINQGDIEAFKL